MIIAAAATPITWMQLFGKFTQQNKKTQLYKYLQKFQVSVNGLLIFTFRCFKLFGHDFDDFTKILNETIFELYLNIRT